MTVILKGFNINEVYALNDLKPHSDLIKLLDNCLNVDVTIDLIENININTLSMLREFINYINSNEISKLNNIRRGFSDKETEIITKWSLNDVFLNDILEFSIYMQIPVLTNFICFRLAKIFNEFRYDYFYSMYSNEYVNQRIIMLRICNMQNYYELGFTPTNEQELILVNMTNNIYLDDINLEIILPNYTISDMQSILNSDENITLKMLNYGFFNNKKLSKFVYKSITKNTLYNKGFFIMDCSEIFNIESYLDPDNSLIIDGVPIDVILSVNTNINEFVASFRKMDTNVVITSEILNSIDFKHKIYHMRAYSEFEVNEYNILKQITYYPTIFTDLSHDNLTVCLSTKSTFTKVEILPEYYVEFYGSIRNVYVRVAMIINLTDDQQQINIKIINDDSLIDDINIIASSGEKIVFGHKLLKT